MRMRRPVGTLGESPRKIPKVLTPGLAGVVLAGLPAAAGGPGCSNVEDPKVGAAQKARVVREAILASLDHLLHDPIRTASHAAGRSAERLGVRVRTLASCALWR